ncbi:AraC family transcriptional regulator [Kitasatospora sp. NPDC096077]|uniref:helix-turn-helix transcriptional regulator n=1 Tax=Kitasatospora sp. NPDC096077 TaxID=3155544 RepID=UPI003328D1D3
MADLPFPTTPGGPPGVEVTDLPGWADRLRALGIARDAPVRPAFHLLVTVVEGRLPCAVDLTECTVDAGQWLWVRPGQILRLREPHDPADTGATGTAVLFQPGFLDRDTVTAAHLDRRAWRLPLAPAPEAEPPVTRTLALLADEYHRLRGLPLEVHVEVVRHLLAVLVLRLSHLPGGDRRSTAGDETFHRFRAAVERDFGHTHRVEQYAARLGYSVRTLTRAANAAVGRSAKGVIDDRLVTEAKRLLLHTDLTAHAVGDRLGFGSAPVFTRFFRHRTGETPTGFRTRARGDGTIQPGDRLGTGTARTTS